MEVKFEEKFKEILKKEAKGFDIDWQLVDIESIHYHSTLTTAVPMDLGKYAVRMRVIEDEIPDVDIDNWFRSHKFIYGMMSKSIRTEFEKTDMMTFDIGTIESIALKTRKAFKNLHK